MILAWKSHESNQDSLRRNWETQKGIVKQRNLNVRKDSIPWETDGKIY